MKLKDKVVIVTGGSGLIGREIIKYLLSEKAIAINAEINVETNIDNGLINCDITSETSIESCINIVMKKYGRIDGLVNNAYPRTIDWGNKFEDVTLESWRKNVDMQMNSTFFFCQKVLEIMTNQQSGSIVNISSIYGIVGNDFTLYEDYGGTSPAAYSAIKGGIVNFTRYLASYYGRKGIRINCVSPGGIFDGQHPSFVKKYEAKVPMRRMGTSDDIAPAVSFLLSDGAQYITGQNLVVDGGWTII